MPYIFLSIVIGAILFIAWAVTRDKHQSPIDLDEEADVSSKQPIVESNLTTTTGEIMTTTGKFGFSASNPIPVNGMNQMVEYLAALRTPDDMSFIWSWSTTSAENIIGDVYRYKLINSKERCSRSIYISPFCSTMSQKAPEGFVLIDSDKREVLAQNLQIKVHNDIYHFLGERYCIKRTVDSIYLWEIHNNKCRVFLGNSDPCKIKIGTEYLYAYDEKLITPLQRKITAKYGLVKVNIKDGILNVYIEFSCKSLTEFKCYFSEYLGDILENVPLYIYTELGKPLQRILSDQVQ